MADYMRDRVATSHSAADASIDMGLRSYMLQVYNYMAAALVLTAVSAFSVANIGPVRDLFFQQVAPGAYAPTILAWIGMIAPIGLVFFLGFRIQKMSFSAAQTTFWVYAGLVGISIASILLNFTGASVARVFFIAAIMFGGMSLYGYTTKKDLSGFGSFLIMGMWGIFIAFIVNLFLQSTMLHYIASGIGVIVFTGLAAYDTQRIKEMYLEADGRETMGKKAIMGALMLYLDFINLFIMLMQFLGVRNSE